MDTINSRACIVIKHDQLSVYLNKAAISKFIEKLEIVKSSLPDEFSELHFAPAIDENYASALLNASHSDVTTIVDEDVRDHLVKAGPTILNGETVFTMPFDLHFMLVSELVLDELTDQKTYNLL